MTPPEQLQRLIEIQRSLKESKVKPKVMVVDDMIEDLIITKHKLNERGISCETTTDGATAIKLIMPQDLWVVFLDWKLTGMSGADTLRAIKKINPSNTVIVITGTVAVAVTLDAFYCGAAAVMPKPLEDEQINIISGSLI